MEEAQIAGLVVAYTQLIKGFIPDRLIPLTAVVVGVFFTSLYDYSNNVFSLTSILKGMVIGTASTGAYSAAKDIATTKKITKK